MWEEHLLAAYMMNGYRDGKPSFVPEKLRKKARRKQLERDDIALT
jgi:hypothetical protein